MGNIKLSEYNVNGSYPSNYLMIIDKIPTVVFSMKTFPIPGFSSGTPETNYVNNSIKAPGDNTVYNDLICTVFINEYYKEHYEIYTWWYNNVSGENSDFTDIFSDAKLLLYNNSFKAISLELKFKNMFPESVGDIMQDNDNTEDTIMECVFKYDYYTPDYKLL